MGSIMALVLDVVRRKRPASRLLSSIRLRRPRPASPDEIRITREGDTAVVEYADPAIRTIHLQLGPARAAMPDAEILARSNAVLEAQVELAAGADRTLTEVPPGRPQIAYHAGSDQ